MTVTSALRSSRRPSPAPAVVLELLKPVTWFPPMWAFTCGAISSGVPLSQHPELFVTGILLTGPLVCGASQAVNDWFDRHVDALNEPARPIPSGRMPGRWGLGVAVFWSGLSLLVGAALGWRGFAATVVGIVLAWAYSAPPIRLKRNGWWGNAAVGLCYEGLAWFTGAAALLLSTWPSLPIVVLALCYSAGAHGIMTLNDFKSIDGDIRSGVRSLPVQLGERRAGLVACAVMLAAQLIVVACFLAWGQPIAAAAIGVSTVIQCPLMARLLTNPKKLAPWYNGTGVTLYVLGMMVSAFAVRALTGSTP